MNFFSSNQLSISMKDFLGYTYKIIRKSFERHVYQIQEKEILKYEEDKSQEINRKKHLNELTGPSKFRSILRDAKTNSKKLPIINGE